MVLNADAAKTMRVEIADERFQLLPAFSGSNGGTADASGGLECPVTWLSEDLSRLGGEKVRLRIRFERKENREPRLYAVYLRTAASE
jgi:hypothetical protein